MAVSTGVRKTGPSKILPVKGYCPIRFFSAKGAVLFASADVVFQEGDVSSGKKDDDHGEH